MNTIRNLRIREIIVFFVHDAFFKDTVICSVTTSVNDMNDNKCIQLLPNPAKSEIFIFSNRVLKEQISVEIRNLADKIKILERLFQINEWILEFDNQRPILLQ